MATVTKKKLEDLINEVEETIISLNRSLEEGKTKELQKRQEIKNSKIKLSKMRKRYENIKVDNLSTCEEKSDLKCNILIFEFDIKELKRGLDLIIIRQKMEQESITNLQKVLKDRQWNISRPA